MAREKDRLKKALGRLNKEEKRKLEDIDEKMRGKNFELSMLASLKLLDVRDFLKAREVIVTIEDIRKNNLEIRKDDGCTQAFDIDGEALYYLCAKDKFGQERDCCGWVRGVPDKEKYKHRVKRKMIKGIKYKCFVCQRIVGEKVL